MLINQGKRNNTHERAHSRDRLWAGFQSGCWRIEFAGIGRSKLPSGLFSRALN
jgi:hypothetical protein